MEVRPVDVGDRQALLEFASRVPEGDRSFIDRNLLSQIAVASWTQAVPERRLVAVDDDGTVAGIVTVVPGVGWTSHVGDIRLIVLPQFRGQGIGRRLAAAGQELAESLGMAKLMVEITREQRRRLAMFAAFGFAEEARLRRARPRRRRFVPGPGVAQPLARRIAWIVNRPLCCPPLFGSPLSEDDAVELAEVLKALADPARLRVMSLIASSPGGEVCACDLAGPWGVRSRR